MKIKSDFHIIPIIIAGIIIIPIYAFIQCCLNSQISERYSFCLFILIVAIERLWETFYSAKERRKYNVHGDWTLPLVSLFYLILGILKITEFFYIKRQINVTLLLISTIIFCYAFALRWIGIKALGRQWSVHAVGAQKVKKIRLLRIGPYKYIRHPIYAGVVLELVSFAIIFNTYYSFLFCLFFNIPMQIIRGIMEEKTSIRKFGDAYLKYQKEVPAFIPIIIKQRQ